jgi:hypothetical protein
MPAIAGDGNRSNFCATDAKAQKFRFYPLRALRAAAFQAAITPKNKLHPLPHRKDGEKGELPQRISQSPTGS